MIIKEKDEKDLVQNHSQNRCISRHMRNSAKESAALIVCGRAFQSLGAELEKSSETKLCFCCVFQQHLESVGVVVMMSKGVVQEYICSLHQC